LWSRKLLIHLAEGLVDVLREQGVQAHYIESYERLGEEIRIQAKPGNIVLGMGARDPELPEFLRSLF